MEAYNLNKAKWKALTVGIVAFVALVGFALAPGLTTALALHGSSNGAVDSTPTPLPVTQVAPSVTTIHAGSLAYSGPASKAIFGPIKATPSAFVPSLSHSLSNSPISTANYPMPNPKSVEAEKAIRAVGAALPATAPTIACQPIGPGCDVISSTSSGAVGVNGLNAIDSSGLYGITIEPADQAVCTGNGAVMEVNNIGELQVYGTKLHQKSGDIALDSVFGLGSIPTSLGGPWSSGGDISCLYDYDNGGHWFITEIVSNSSWAIGGPFGGCFVAAAYGCFEGIAVSVSNDPLGPYNVYFVNANYNPSEPGYPYFLNDFAKIGTTKDAFLYFYDEFPLRGGGFGGGGFNGAQEFAIDKKALELGFPVVEPAGGSDPYFTVAVENMGLLATPDGTCAGTGGATCWYQVIPAQSPDPTQFDNTHGGVGYMMGSLDFNGAGDTRVAVFEWTHLSDLNSYNCAKCGGITFGGTVYSGVESYYNPGFVAPQKAGPIPLGDNCVAFGLNGSATAKCPEGDIATNGDGFTQASQAGGQIWGAISTADTQTYATGTGCPCAEAHIGVAYYVFSTHAFDLSGVASLTDQAYVTAAHEELEFPAIAAEGSHAQDGGNMGALITFSLSGNGGPKHADGGGFFPSTAFGRLTSSSHGLVGATMYIADKGKAPQDGFTEYQGYPGGTRPRWGDYSEAIFLPFSGGKVYFSTNYIQSPACTDAAFLIDPSCGGTRDPFANWGTSINYAVG